MKRKTTQREAIQDVFSRQDRPLGIEEILVHGRTIVASLNQATVYRNLKSLTEKGWLCQIHHPSLGTLYERAGKEHHHHFHCNCCNQLYCLSGCPLSAHGITPEGFVLEGHELFLNGVCPSCSTKQPVPPA